MFINKEVSSFKKHWLLLQIAFNASVQLQIKEKIQVDKSPLMELDIYLSTEFYLKRNPQNTKNPKPKRTTITKPLFNMCNPISTTVTVNVYKFSMKERL